MNSKHIHGFQKGPKISMRMGYAKRNRGNGSLNWSHLIKIAPRHCRKHILRIRNDYEKLAALRGRLYLRGDLETR